MNDDYDKHIVQKYRLAIAIAIIKNTPGNSNRKIYLERLRNNIIPDMEPYDPDMTICEDDFNFNDNDKNEKAITDLNSNNETQLIDSQANDSITILKDFDFNDMMRNINNDKDTIENHMVSDVLQILKGVDNEEIINREISVGNDDGNSLKYTQSTYYEGSQNLLPQKNVPVNENTGQIKESNPEFANVFRGSEYKRIDSINDTLNQKTNINSMENAVLHDSHRRNTYHENVDNFTHVSQSLIDNLVLPRYFIEKERPIHSKSKLPDNSVQQTFNSDGSKTFENNIQGNYKNIRQTHGNPDAIIINDDKIVDDNKKHKFDTEDNNTIDNIQVKRSRNVEKDFNCNTDISYFDEIKNKINMNTRGINTEISSNDQLKTKANDLYKNLFISDNDVEDSLDDFNEKLTHFNRDFKKDLENKKRNNIDKFGSQTSNESINKANKIAYNSQAFSQFSQEFDSEPSNDITKSAIEASNSTNQKTVVEDKDEEDQIIEDLFDKLTDSQAEVVPFKVLEELNKVKSFLNKQNWRNSVECVSDSGYKSDSHSRSIFKSASQSSNIWVNQSAHCLLSYITSCPLVVNTEEITNEISRTLGRLIDRLHEEEKYPSFLDEHLQTVDSLVKQIYEEQSADKLLKKDENIYRLFLLNKSSHIIKYTTEKIVLIIQDILAALTNDELLEVTRTVQTENLPYVFHILETLIKKLLVHKNLSQQSTQNSQEDDVVLKRSSITDIWRKKWNPTKKHDSDSVCRVKQCVLERCSEVLNRLIVQAMDGYSLISYFALQCFNLLQN